MWSAEGARRRQPSNLSGKRTEYPVAPLLYAIGAVAALHFHVGRPSGTGSFFTFMQNRRMKPMNNAAVESIEFVRSFDPEIAGLMDE